MSETWMDFAIKLQRMRRAVGFTQKQLAKHSKVGEKTLSTFESGWRTDSITVAQLMALTSACGYTVAEFMEKRADEFGPSLVARSVNRRPSKSAYLRQYRKQQKRSMSLTAAVPIIRPKRGITIFRSSDLLQSSLGGAQRL